MRSYALEPIAVVGVAAIMPDAPDAATFWANIHSGRYSIGDVPADRWDPQLYYDPDPHAPDKTYSRIGGWVREYPWDPIAWRLPIPPTVAAQFDPGQKWAVAAARAALLDAGWPNWGVDAERVAVVIGNAIGGEKHYRSNLRIESQELFRELAASPSFAALPESVRGDVLAETRKAFLANFHEITEDTMPGELANIIAGRVANLFDFRGPNFTTDAACASGLAATAAAVRALQAHDCDAAVTGGVDRNMGVAAFVKFCKIGALSATGTRPFDAGADGFVMGEGAALFVLKRLSDAERAGDRVYAVLLGMAGSSDGKGKGITAPNPVGQRLAVERAWRDAEADPASASYVEAHGTSTRVGDAAELESLTAVFGAAGAPPGAIALGSVKSNIGHLKAAAGSAGLFKTVLSLHHKLLAPSLHFDQPNPNVDWATTPFRVNTERREWPVPPGGVRRAGVSAFGFGGTNFHLVLEEYQPGRHRPPDEARTYAVSAASTTLAPKAPATTGSPTAAAKAPPRGALVIGADTEAELATELARVRAEAQAGNAPAPAAPDAALAGRALRLAIDHADAAELAAKAAKAGQALAAGNPAAWRMLRAQGVHLGRGPAPKVAFLYPGQGSQYMNMLRELREREPVVAATFDEADEIMRPLLERPLSTYVFGSPGTPDELAVMERQLLQTEITQPAMLTADLALTRLLACYGVRPDATMGHSLGEYGALVAAGALSFEGALEAVSARGHEMANLHLADPGAMVAVFGPLERIEEIVAGVDGYLVIANINSTGQAVVGGATAAVERAVAAFQAAGMTATRLPVSHAFHTSIVAPASEPLTAALRRLELHPPVLPVVSNVTGRFYPSDADVETMLDLLGRQVAAPVQFVTGLRTLYDAGIRVFVEVGPKKALHGFVEDVLGGAHDDVLALFTNHPKVGEVPAFNQALCGLYASGLGYQPVGPTTASAGPVTVAAATPRADAAATAAAPAVTAAAVQATATTPVTPVRNTMSNDRYAQLGHLFAEVLEQGMRIHQGNATGAAPLPAGPRGPVDTGEPVVITGAALGLPGVERMFDDANIGRILAGQQFIDAVPHRFRKAMVDRRITRLVKSATADPTFETIGSEADVVKLAGRHAPVDVVTEFGVDADRDAALDVVTRLAIGAGVDALRDAGIPLVMHYRTTTLGTSLPERWGLPDALRDDTGIIFASAFPGYDSFAHDLEHYFTDRGRREQLLALEAVNARLRGDEPAAAEVRRRIEELRHLLATEPFEFNRRFLFRCLSMGHSQLAELIGARGPNTQLNAACASTTQAIGVAQDWIRAGRCRRVVIVSADDVTSDALLPWVASGFLASGAAATDDAVEDAATPFDRRRHGMIIGTGAAGLVVESAQAARERGLQPICEVLATVTANSAYHGSRLDVDHIGQVMERLAREAEARGVNRHEIASSTVFVSHETYTPARGGSASAEIEALRRVFGADADAVVITNTKGFTGHAMAAGVEDVVAVKALETGVVPPVPNFKEPDPELGRLNLSTGGAYPVRYALRLAAGFGSQIAMSLLRWTPVPDGAHRAPSALGYAYRIVDQQAWQRWLDTVSGRPDARLEVVQRRLRVAETGNGARPAVARTAAPEPTAHPVPAPVPQREPEREPAPAARPVTVAAPSIVEFASSTVESVPSAVPATDEIAEQVVGIVAQLTGYPPELLEPDLDLEADLGVDTVKQAEVFAAVRERFGVERDDNLKLRDFPTLTHVVGWVKDKRATAPAVAAPASPAAPAPAPEAPAPADDDITAQVVGIVAQLTGYPPELLEPDLDLEADLGVDTVKQAEVFAAVRERFGVERDDNLKLRDFPTLTHVVGWVRDKTATTAPAAPAASPAAHAPAVRATVSVVGDPDAADALPRRVPVPALRPDLSACVPTGVALGAGSRVVVQLDEGGVGEALVARLGRLGVQALALPAGLATDEALSRVDGWLADGPVHGVYWLPALDDEGALDALDSGGWREALRRRVGVLHAVMRRLYEHAPFLVAGVRLGGYHGYDAAGATCPMGGAVTGFAKAYRRERSEALVKAVDFGLSRKTASLADVLVAETLRDPGCVEIGYGNGHRFGVGLVERPFEDGSAGLDLGPDSVFLVTGAAGSIVSAITADLAGATKGTFHLLDLTPEPDPADADLRRYAEDRDGLKTELAQRLRARGERPTPVVIDKELARLERLHAALAAIQAVREAGGSAFYHQVDLTDAGAVAAVLDRVRETSGRIDVLLHAAGLEISHALPDKPASEFDLVFGVKAHGWFNVLHAAGETPIGATVVFSSVAGRFGNAGQTDYSAANDLLCKITSGLRRSRPGTRGLALDWTAWGGIGMATRGSIPKVMEMAGVQLLPPEAGVAWVRRELTGSGYAGEVVVAGELGAMAAEYHPTGGLDPAALDTSASGPMVGEAVAASVHDGLVVRTTLDPGRQPFLSDHRIDGTAVLPGVMGLEAFAETARLLAPGWYVTDVADVDFHAPVKFYRDEPRTLTISAALRPDGPDLVAHCRLSAERVLPGAPAPQRTVHFTGTVRLTRTRPEPPDQPRPDTPPAGTGIGATDVYRLYFHGPAYQVVAGGWRSGDGVAARLAGNLPADHEPAQPTTVLAPRLVELCFQTAGLWEAGVGGRMALPHHVGRLRLYREPVESDDLVALARPAGDGFDCAVLDGQGVVLTVSDYRTVALPQPLPEDVRAPLRAGLLGTDADDGVTGQEQP